MTKKKIDPSADLKPSSEDKLSAARAELPIRLQSEFVEVETTKTYKSIDGDVYDKYEDALLANVVRNLEVNTRIRLMEVLATSQENAFALAIAQSVGVIANENFNSIVVLASVLQQAIHEHESGMNAKAEIQ